MIYKARLILKAAGITRSPLKSDIAWSSITAKDEKAPIEYEVFQTAINAFCKAEGIIPIEFDYCYWQESNEDFSKELGKIMDDEKKKTALIKELKEAIGK